MIPTYTENGDLPGFDGESSLVAASFDFRFADLPSETSTAGVAVVQLGYNSGIVAVGAVRFGFRADGSLTYSDGTGSSQLLTSFSVDDISTWTKKTTLLDYGSSTYSFQLDDGEWSPSYDFQISGSFAPTEVINPRLQNIGSADHRRMVFDNIQYSVIPEPSSAAALFAVFSLGLVFCARKRNG
jgi:hypothetical protein